MNDIKCIAFDLDDTLLTKKKELTARNRAALEKAANLGIELIPATGRFYLALPEEIREWPYLHYAILINGAQILDVQKQETIYSKEIPVETALDVFSWFDTLPVIYDCYVDGWGYMNKAMLDSAHEYIINEPSLQLVRSKRTPVPELKAFLIQKQRSCQKLQLFTKKDIAFRDELIGMISERYPMLAVSSSLPNNIEINDKNATKGNALLWLAGYLGLDVQQTAAFGDGRNDLSMIREAGIGIAMENAHPDVKAAADYIARSCEEDGVGIMIETITDNA